MAAAAWEGGMGLTCSKAEVLGEESERVSGQARAFKVSFKNIRSYY